MGPDTVRRTRLLEALTASGLDALLVSSASDVLLLTGYWPIMAMSLAVLTRDGECRLLLPEDEDDLAAATSATPRQTFEPETLHKLVPFTSAVEEPLRKLVRGLHLEHARIGIREELTEQPSSYVVSANFHHALAQVLNRVCPGATLVGADHLLEQQKAAKCPAEMQRLERAAGLVAAGFGSVVAAVQPGLREYEVASRVQSAFDSAAPGEVQRSYGAFYCMSGPNAGRADAAYARTRTRVLEPGDLVMIHANTCADGMWTDVTRTYTVGPPDERQIALRQALHEARKAALASVRPGVAARDVDAAARNVMKAHGLADAFKHATGHGVGFAAANAAGQPRIHPLSPDVLEAGMTFNIEPAVYFPGYGGMRHCDLVAVTEDGARVLTDF